MAVTDAYFRTLGQLKANALQSRFAEYSHEQRADGFFYYTSYTLHPDVVAVIVDMQLAGGGVLATGATEPKPARTPRTCKEGVVSVTQQIRDWALANPQATKLDALAAFPGVNPSTVGVQFGKARKG